MRSCSKRDRLEAWVARAREIGIVAINAETVGEDPMQATLCGIALAVAPNEACYVPLAHRKGGNGDGGLFGGERAPDQLSEDDALAALKPLLEDPGVLKIGQNLKFEWQLFAVRGIELALARGHHADVLRARRRPLRPWHRRAGAALLQSHRDRVQRRHRHRQSQGRLRLRRVRQGRALRRRGRRPGAAADAGAAAAHGRRAHDQRLRDAGASAAAGAGAHGAARHLGRPPGAVAALGRVRAARRRPRSRGARARRRSVVQSGQPEAARRHPVRQDGAARRHQDQDRPVGDRRARARRARRAGPRAAAEDSRMAAGHQAEIDLHRRAARLHQPDHQARAHQLRAGGDADRPALVIRAEPAEHPDPHRGRPQDPARLHRRARATSSPPPTIRRSSCGCSPRSATSSCCARRSATASTSMR